MVIRRQKLWKYFLFLSGEHFQIEWFIHQYNANFSDLKSNESEQVDWYSVDYVLNKNSNILVPNLKWIIPLALDEANISAVYYQN